MEPKGSPRVASKTFRVASHNAGVHVQSEVTFVHHVSTMSKSRLPTLPCFLLRFDFGPVHFFQITLFLFDHALTCNVPSCFYWQALLRRLHESVPMYVPASAGMPVPVCPMPTILGESIHLLGLRTTNHWATLSTTRHRAIHRHTQIKVNRKYASRSKGK